MISTASPLLIGSLLATVAVIAFGALLVWQLHRARRRGTYSPLTEDLLRLPGHGLRREADALGDRVLELYLRFVAMGVLLGGAWFIDGGVGIRWTATVLVGAVMLWTLRQVPSLVRKFHDVSLGREGEEYVGQELNLLMRDGAFVFHDIPYRWGNIDHVVGHDRVLVVETKARRKPRGSDGERSREARVRFDGTHLVFPDGRTDEPIEQARRHADHVRAVLGRLVGAPVRVVPVVALPGWYVESVPFEQGGVLVVNAKRAKVLRRWIGRPGDRALHDRMRQVARHLDGVARTVAPGSRRIDPNASEHLDVWMRPKATEPRLG